MLLLGLLPAFGSEFVTLTDTEGRSIQAKIITTAAGIVTVVLDNGHQFRIPMDRLDEKSRNTVDLWSLKRVKNMRDPFKFTIRSFTENVEVGSTTSTRTRTYDEGYAVTVENGSPMIMPELTVEYLLVKEDVPRAERSTREREYETIKDSVKIPSLGLRESTTFNTKTFAMDRSSLKGGWSYVGGGSRSSRDGLAGIWIKVKSGETVIYEYSRPSKLSDKVNWDGTAND